MDPKHLLQYIQEPETLKEVGFETLKEWLQAYPYSQNLQYLLVKKSKQENHPEFERHLRQAATYMNSRSFLRQKLNENTKTIIGIPPVDESIEDQASPQVATVNELPVEEAPDEDLPEVTFIPDESEGHSSGLEETDLSANHIADTDVTTPPPSDEDDLPPQDSIQNKTVSLQDLSSTPTLITETIAPPEAISEIERTKEAIYKEEFGIENPSSNEPKGNSPRIHYYPEESSENDTVEDMIPEDADASSDVFAVDSQPEPIVVHNEYDDDDFDEFDDDELEELLNEPLIEVYNDPIRKDEIPEETFDIESEDTVIPDLPEEMIDYSTDDSFENDLDFDEEEVEEPEEDTVELTPGMSKWMKKYQASQGSEEEKTSKKEKKKSKKAKKAKLTDKKADLEEDLPVKKKKKTKKKKKKDKKKGIKAFARQSIVENDEIVSETLAELLVRQGSIQKGIDMYDRLSLIFPEKKAFFAARIQKLKNL